MYNCVPDIYNELHGIKKPFITPKMKKKLISMFALIQLLLDDKYKSCKFRPLSYGYVIFKLLQLLKFRNKQTLMLLSNKFNINDDMCWMIMTYFDVDCLGIQMVRTKEKLKEHDRIFRIICEELGWKFIPTL